ncbi:MAG: hypothetical protein E6Q97_14240 [Desulfurellales bacterium]|nr:MAG: hypothetical protein E6Q97_14240 [Desulfurellales bacterium]
MNTCAICGKSSGLFELRIEEDGDETLRHVCGKCWDTIAGIALRAVSDRLDALENRLAELEDHEVSPYEAAMIIERANER